MSCTSRWTRSRTCSAGCSEDLGARQQPIDTHRKPHTTNPSYTTIGQRARCIHTARAIVGLRISLHTPPAPRTRSTCTLNIIKKIYTIYSCTLHKYTISHCDSSLQTTMTHHYILRSILLFIYYLPTPGKHDCLPTLVSLYIG